MTTRLDFHIFRTLIPGAGPSAPTFLVVEGGTTVEEIEQHIRAAAGYVPGLRVEMLPESYADGFAANDAAMAMAAREDVTFAPWFPPAVEKIEWRDIRTPYMIDQILEREAQRMSDASGFTDPRWRLRAECETVVEVDPSGMRPPTFGYRPR